MHVMTATRRGQGDSDQDFSDTVDGELVVIPIDVCAEPKCGCERAVTGIGSGRGSTTFTVADHPHLTPDLYTELIRDGLTRHGLICPTEQPIHVTDFIRWHIDLAARLPVGALLRVNANTKTIICIEDGPPASEAA